MSRPLPYFELVTLTGSDPGYRAALRTDKSLWISRKPNQELNDEYDIVHIPGCWRRAQFKLRWDDRRNQFLFTNEKALDIIQINGAVIERFGKRWLNDGDVIDIYGPDVFLTKVWPNGEVETEDAQVRIRFQAKLQTHDSKDRA